MVGNLREAEVHFLLEGFEVLYCFGDFIIVVAELGLVFGDVLVGLIFGVVVN